MEFRRVKVNTRDKLLEIAGKTNFSDSPKSLDVYAEDCSLVPRGTANYAVKLKKATQIQKVIELANEKLIPVVPVSSKMHFNGCTIPKQGGIVMDLSGMNQ